MTADSCVVCGKPAAHKHHRKMRSQGGGDEPANLIAVCLDCHTFIHANPSEAYARGLLVHSWDDPEYVEVFSAVESVTHAEEVRAEKNQLDSVARMGEMIAEDAAKFFDTKTLQTDYSVGGHEKFENVVTVVAIEEGEPCPTCKRRIPHRKKASTPKSKVWSTRVPLDDAETFSELVDAAAEHHGLTGRPYHRFWTLQFALVLLLQAEKGELPG